MTNARRPQRGDSLMIVIVLMIAVPCLLGAAWLSYRSLWFMFAAERASGEIVEISGDVPRLHVEFHTEGGDYPRRIESAGSDLYRNFMVGDRVQVYYDPAQPADARLALFVEMWLFPLLAGGFGGFWLLGLIFLRAAS